MKIITFSIKDNINEKLKKYLEETGFTISQVMRNALHEYMKYDEY